VSRFACRRKVSGFTAGTQVSNAKRAIGQSRLLLRPDADRGGHVRVELPLVHARDDAHFADAEPLGIAGQRVRRGARHPVGDGTSAHVEHPEVPPPSSSFFIDVC